ncbi:insulinase family protein [Pedobacter sp. HMF7647]|uniref:Insulinase family protein n=1 Tax=Hufsiella arboris TaxID=2695275 RepID=A0A7K1Y6N4_9SPHI|nr:pitrilysin family protein [Hufsiella arboris]MXV50234.1 insulinase family protein [Hufsiella arboris]
MINRTEAPAFRQVEHIEFIEAKPIEFSNGLKTFVVSGGEQDILKLEFIFKNVNWDYSKPLRASAVNSMLTEGTSTLTASQIANHVDYYGAFLQTENNYDFSSVIVYTLNKHLENILPVIKSIVTDSVFPEKELQIFKRNQRQKLSVMLEKNDIVGRRTFSKAIFGDTQYGHQTEAFEYDELSRESLVDYFSNSYKPANCTLLVSGKVEDDAIRLLEQFFGKDNSSEMSETKISSHFPLVTRKEIYIERPDSIQSAIRIGKACINRSHTDFAGLQVLNTVLGGYFGSRLMANIREDKGFTYGIGSALVSLEQSGYFFIASEVGTDVCQAALTEIEKEVNLLKAEKISDDELGLVRNFMLGSLLGSLENAFSHADKFKNIYFYGLDYGYYDRYIQTIKTITPEKLMELANEYLNFDEFVKVIVGKN